MQQTGFVGGATSKSIVVRAIVISTGSPKTDLVFDTATIVSSYKRSGATAAVSITLVTLANAAAAWTSGGFVHIANGVYRFDIPDAAFVAGVDYVSVGLSGVADCFITGAVVDIYGTDPRAAALTAAAIGTQVVATAAGATAGSIGLAAANAAASAATAAGYGAPPAATAIRDSTLDALLSAHTTSGSVAAGITLALNSAATAATQSTTGAASAATAATQATTAATQSTAGAASAATAATQSTTAATQSTAANVAAAAVKVKTDQLRFTVALQVDSNALTGGGGATADAIRLAHLNYDITSDMTMRQFYRMLATVFAGTRTADPSDPPTFENFIKDTNIVSGLFNALENRTGVNLTLSDTD